MVTFSAPAYSELLERVTRLAKPSAGVVVAWHEAQVDHVRAQDGKPVWKEVEPAGWRVVVMPLADLEVKESQLENVGDLKVFLLGKAKVETVSVDFANGQFSVRENAT